jgi:prepilin-type processing-associated H-X9-DG protein
VVSSGPYQKLRRTSLYSCPTREAPETGDAFHSWALGDGAMYYPSYICNGWDSNLNTSLAFPSKLTRTRFPDELVWLIDGRGVRFPNWAPMDTGNPFVARHDSRVNAVHADGHVSSITGPLPSSAVAPRMWKSEP